jgi:diaminopimelate epimerase
MLAKYHALGNDYFVGPAPSAGESPWTPGAIASLCDRRRGWGSDGLLLTSQSDTGWRVQIFNADGTEAEKSGNGVRIAAKFLRDEGYFQGPYITLKTLGGNVVCRFDADGELVAAKLGKPTFLSTEIPVAGEPREVLQECLEVDGHKIAVTALSLGNPHCVVFCPEISRSHTEEFGPKIEHHPYFPHRTNVQFAKLIERNCVEAEIWERGSGRTLSSGTSAAAMVSAGCRLGWLDRKCDVIMPGGRLTVSLDDDSVVEICGPVHRVGKIQIFS